MSHADQVRALINGGAKIIQIREKIRSAGDWIGEANLAVRAARLAGIRIIINDRVDIALAVGADGVHLGQDDLPPEAARRILGDDAIIGFSTHTIEQVRDACRMAVDYIAFGPVFATSTKADPDPTVGLRQFERAKAAAGDIPLVAIGGIDATNIKTLFQAGAASAAMIGAILRPGGEITRRMQFFNNITC